MSDATEDIPEVDYVEGSGIPIHGNDIDTDQIIPARFMKVVTFDGLGEFAFFDLRFDDEDNEKDHPFNEERFQDSNVMVVNNNFGCGSSREHAPQALMRWGIDAIIGEGFAEIFAGNCLALGIPTVTADHETINALQQWVDDNPDGEIEVDVRAETVTYGDNEINVSVDRAQREALVEGNWDTTALMKANKNAIEETASQLPYLDQTRSDIEADD
ncbi:3-isopropylmalate dehydratase small subunit [Haloarcula quadrata]|uniref:3-isopropylmalate dehydratase n=3 Tax=Haloarcula TaxID=2237 RepID=Q5V517_HALMA|nr:MULTISPECIES: 3-isopropylmalate dehydratase small subunit [Haloarcula]AAV45385.1 3-isopropylmalate dehydratase small subunit [Haloarcula marismortui ATCC 43049]EMA13031.1 3-isopropylmalate dehydratase small subunit [Haloarcula sinaiiensis ATCC 33800]NHX38756.1 3-isopropylmalate dehydratase small subunit [Haloarcula sp. R1-2]QCP93161.1 3-isopropylmalate dehydratase small subunit [Haloarcula marismortui ATCC 43049]QUJ70698.1 3-isopropylmalate dehydratase small subunit [Haloarcula sinaiiensis 